jgi:hypothetical protein
VIPRLVILLSAACVCAAAASAASAAPSPGSARLEGEFVMSGTVTTSVNIRGEHKGETVTRRWTFTPTCGSGACSTIQLARRRRHATDRLTLTRTEPGVYAGQGLFYAPLRCGGKTYPHGESVPFTIQVTVTAAARINGASRATQISATYRNRVRHNLTNCVAIPGHDAARYTGALTGSTFPL